jgi:hypothetical protein
MSRLVLVLGRSGTGKTSSLRNLRKEEVGVISCSGKEMPFKNDLTTYTPPRFEAVYNVIETSTKPMIVIDDLNYMSSFSEMAAINESGYGKFARFANELFLVFKKIIDKPGDQIFYIIGHQDEDESGHIKLKTTGKMLSEKIVLEGLVNIILGTEASDGEFLFRVQTNGKGLKSPIGMFDTPTVSNDLKLVDTAIRKFYAPLTPITPSVPKKVK